MGTYVTIFLEGGERARLEAACADAFAEAERMATLLSPFDPESTHARLNALAIGGAVTVEPEFIELWERARAFQARSGSAFDPGALDAFTIEGDLCARNAAGEFDLRGVAKGFVVDQALERLFGLRGWINAGGDLRVLSLESETSVELRLGTLEAPCLRRLRLTQPAVATSSLAVASGDPRSSTVYRRRPREGLTTASAVTVMAPTAEIADALCKVGLFAEPAIIEACAREWSATVLVFDAQGEPIEAYQGA